MVEGSLIRGALQNMPANDIVDTIAEAAAAWTDPQFEPRSTCASHIATRTGYSLPVVQFALDHLFGAVTSSALHSTIASELGSIDALDRFIARPGRPDAFADRLGDVCIIASRTTIGVALLPAIFALCAKCDVTVKDREDQLIAEFFRTLAERNNVFAYAARARSYDSREVLAPFIRQFSCVVAFGKDQTLESIRNSCAPDTRFIGFGSRASAGYIAITFGNDDARLRELLERAARDVLLYETEGCMSLHVLFVEGRANAHRVAEGFADALSNASRTFPRGANDDATAARFASVRNAAAFRASLGESSLFSGESHAVIFSPLHQDPPSFGPRCISVVPVDKPDEALRYLTEHGVALEAFALSETRDDIVQMAIDAGAVRLTRFGALQTPPASGNHGGRPRITDFVRWIDRET